MGTGQGATYLRAGKGSRQYSGWHEPTRTRR